MASGSNAPFSGEFVDLENVPTLPTGVTSSEATEKIKLDNQSIVKNNNGKATVSQPSTKVIGSFNSSFGDWTKSGTGQVSRESSQSVRGSHSIRLFASNDGSAILKRDIDFSNVSKLKFFADLVDSDSKLAVFLDNDTIANLESSTSGFAEFVKDVSNQNGIKTLKFESQDFSFKPDSDVFVDNIRITKPKKLSVGGGSGS